MKIEILELVDGPEGLRQIVTGTIARGSDGTYVTSGAGQRILSAVPMMYYPPAHKKVTPSDPEYLDALVQGFRNGYLGARYVDESPEAGLPHAIVNIDADVRNADWPKRTPDRMEDLQNADASPPTVRRRARPQMEIWEAAGEPETRPEGIEKPQRA